MTKEELKDFINFYYNYKKKIKEISKEYFLDRTDWVKRNKFTGNRVRIIKYLRNILNNKKEYLIDEIILFINGANYTIYHDLEILLSILNKDLDKFMEDGYILMYGNVQYKELTKKYLDNDNINSLIELLSKYMNDDNRKMIFNNDYATNVILMIYIGNLFAYVIYNNLINTQYEKTMNLFNDILNNLDNEAYLYKYLLSDVDINSSKDCIKYFDWYFNNEVNHKLIKKDML